MTREDRLQAAAETYIGLVEVGVGLIPAGGGTKEFVRSVRASRFSLELNRLIDEVFFDPDVSRQCE